MSSRGRWVALAMLLVLLALAGVLLLWPTHPNTAAITREGLRIFNDLARDGVPRQLLRPGLIEFAGNIALFVPLGALASLALPRRLWWVAALGCLLLSGAVETAQLLFLHGRTFAIRDIAGNTLGGLVGVGIVSAVRALTARRRPPRRARGEETLP